MKLNKFIQDNCCNIVKNECTGVWNTKRFNDTNDCWPLMKEDPAPCQYFEKVVLPLAIKLNCYKELVNEYSQVDFDVIKRTKAVRDKLKVKKKRQIVEKR